MADMQNTYMPEDTLQYRITFIPDFNKEESLCILKIHHVMGDGLALMLLLGVLQDNYTP
jgi:hypothetical protein